MKRSFRILRWLVVLLAAVFVLMQFFRMPKTNPAIDPNQTIESHLQVSPQVAAMFDRSCNDCHSNNTRWPWYANVAPVSWFGPSTFRHVLPPSADRKTPRSAFDP